MSAANLTFDNFIAFHNAVNIMNQLPDDEWVTINLNKNEKGAYLLPSSNEIINLLNEKINELMNMCEEAGVIRIIGCNLNFSSEKVKLLEKTENLGQERFNTVCFKSLEMAWFDFGILVNSISSILTDKLKSGIYESEAEIIEKCGFLDQMGYLIVHTVEMMKLSSICNLTINGKGKTIH